MKEKKSSRTFDIYNPAKGTYWHAKKGDLTVVDSEVGLLAYKQTVILIPFGATLIAQLKRDGFIKSAEEKAVHVRPHMRGTQMNIKCPK